MNLEKVIPRLRQIALGGLIVLTATRISAQAVVVPVEETENARPFWGLALGVRLAHVPFVADDDTVADLFPLFYYEGERIFLRGLEGGVKVVNQESWGANLLGRYRFFGVPREYQDDVRGDALDMGVQLVWTPAPGLRLEVEGLGDSQGHMHGIARVLTEHTRGRWYVSPQLEVRAKTAHFNSAYYGLGTADIGGGVDVRARLQSRLHVHRKLHLVGAVEAGLLDDAARRSPVVDRSWEWEAYLGVGFFREPLQSAEPLLDLKPYLRVAQGWGSDSRLGEILMGQNSTQPVAVRMTSVFYGHPLSERFFDWPLEVFLTPGIVHHYASSDQDAATEYVLAVKFYYTIPLPWRVRLGLAEGISHLDSMTYYEAEDLARKNYRASRLLNYLDLSADLNLGDVFKSPRLEDLWLGVAIHHRSGIFETSSLFGRIKGGSNFNTVYVQWSL